MSEKVQKVLSRLGNIWPKKLDDDGVVEWFAEYETLLRNYEPWVLDAATTRIIGSKKTPGFPLPREVIDACEQVLADDRRTKPRMFDRASPVGDPYKLADDLIRCDLGKRAAREGWALTLRDFIAEKHRLPDDREIRRLIQIRNEFVTKLTECKTGRGGLFGAPLAKLGQSMVNREHEIAKRILGNEAGEWYAGKF